MAHSAWSTAYNAKRPGLHAIFPGPTRQAPRPRAPRHAKSTPPANNILTLPGK